MDLNPLESRLFSCCRQVGPIFNLCNVIIVPTRILVFHIKERLTKLNGDLSSDGCYSESKAMVADSVPPDLFESSKLLESLVDCFMSAPSNRLLLLIVFNCCLPHRLRALHNLRRLSSIAIICFHPLTRAQFRDDAALSEDGDVVVSTWLPRSTYPNQISSYNRSGTLVA